ncbi:MULTISPECIES: hypothetical protein [Streptococcus]|uniref:Lipoprotein n=1 Tax=Streptococcus viridans TaxID=78535 RepID=A0A447Z6V7_9STRE|nr:MULTISPECIES: hypothetical protein [Streptococcus]VED68016.1 lipoprotein [Streptococcus viridans]VEE19004.1 lipoprotein [Streptococcus australis]
MKTKGTLFSLSTLALTAVLLLSGCGSEKKKETSPSSTSKIAQVKQSSTSKKEEKKTTSKTTQSTEVAQSPAIASSETQASQENPSTPVTPRVPEVSQGLVPTPSKETKPAVTPAPEKPKLPSLEEGRTTAKEQASKTENPRYKGVLAYASGDYSGAIGSWTDGRDTGVSIGQGGKVTIQTPGGDAVGYTIGSYEYNLDQGHYHAGLISTQDGSAASLDIVVGQDGQVASVQVTENGHAHALVRE